MTENSNKILHLPIEVQNSGLIQLTKLNQYFSAINQGTLRQWIFKAQNGNDRYNVLSFVTKIAGRVYVKIPEFLKWLDEQGQVA